MSKAKQPAYYVRVRRYPDTEFASVWVCSRVKGGGHAGWLHGELRPRPLADLIAALGLPVVEEVSPMPTTPAGLRLGVTSLAQQAELFPEEG